MSVSARAALREQDDLGWTRYVWLIFLPLVLVEPARDGASAFAWAAHVMACALLVVVYIRAQQASDDELAALAVVPVVLGIGLTVFNPAACLFFVYAATFAAKLEQTRKAAAWVACISVVALIAGIVSHGPIYYWLGQSVFTLLIGGVNLHFIQVARANATARELAAVAERERIARDLHDLLGHTLSLIVLKAELASKLADRDPARAAREIRDVESVSRAALKEVREAIRGYHPTVAEELVRARAILDSASVATTVDATMDPRELNVRDGVQEVMALALREAVTRVVRHSRASQATIRLARDANGLAVLQVSDNGQGSTSAEGAGLRGMRERVEAIGGSVTRASANGMRVTIALPLAVGAHEQRVSA